MDKKRGLWLGGFLFAIGLFFSCEKSDVVTTTTSTTTTDTTTTTKDTTTTTTVAKTAGTLTVSTTTSSAGGNYAPRNVMAIWIETSAGVYVKSLMVYGQNYRSYLTHWRSNSSSNTTDATTGATLSGHSTRTCSWNGTNASRVVVADGTYRVCMELTDKNATGNYSYFTFTKGTTAATVSPSSVASFSNISIKWSPN